MAKNGKEPGKLDLERRSLEVGKWANLFMAGGGVTAAFLSNSDALLVDGLYSGVNFVSAIIAARIGAAVVKPADRRYPFGYDAQEALYVTFRSLVLIGIIVFAAFGAVEKIFTYLQGGDVPELVFGPILVYMVLMVTICFGLSYWHHHNWTKLGKRSDILRTESRASVVDGVISMGAGGALLSASLLRGTSLAGIVPVADAITVLCMSVAIIGQPVRMFRNSLREVAGEAADAEVGRQVRQRTEEHVKDQPFSVVDVVVTKLGRTYFVVPYLKPREPIRAEQVDELRDALLIAYRHDLGSARAEIIVTGQPPHEPEQVPAEDPDAKANVPEDGMSEDSDSTQKDA